MTNLTLSSAVITLILQKPNFLISVFPGYIVFGEILQLAYVELKSFEINRFNLSDFFVTIVKLIECISTKSNIKIPFLPQNDQFYFWEVKDDTSLTIGIEKNSTTKYSTILSLDEFNNFLHFFYEILPCTILLHRKEAEIFLRLSQLPLKEILDLSKDTSVLDTFQDTSINFVNISVLIKTNLDVIIIMHKLSTLFKTDYLSDSINKIIS